jgi:hypothetical protein
MQGEPMKAKMKLRIRAMSRKFEEVSPSAVVVAINVSGDGSVVGEDDLNVNEARAEMMFQVKPAVADVLQFGQTLFVTVSTEDE